VVKRQQVRVQGGHSFHHLIVSYMALAQNYKSEKKAVRRSMIAVAVISVIASLCLLAVPLYLFQIYDRVLFSRSYETLIALSAIVVLVLLTFGVLDTIRNMLLTRIGVRFESRVSGLLLAAELAQPSGANKVNMLLLANIRQVVSSNVFPSLFDLPVVVIFTVIVFMIHPLLGGVVLAGIVILLILTFLGEIATAEGTKETQSLANQASRKLDSQFRQHELIRALGLYREAVADWGTTQGKHLSQLVRISGWGHGFSAASKTARQLVQIALIGGGAALVLTDQVTAGIIFATSVVGSRALAPIEAIVNGWRQLKQASLSLKQLDKRFETLTLPDESTPLPRPTGRMVADKVVFVPGPGQKPILKGITGAIEPGQIVAIIGPSGAGKSTFARTLIGYLEPSSGQILLDGQDLKAWDPVTRGMHMGYLPQQVGFFEGTVRDNIARMRRQDPPELAVEAAQFAGVHDMILGFPEGYDTVISETGFQPSGGQKQLLGLARAYYGAPSFVVLDEPNANLDNGGEQILYQTLTRARKEGIATVVVTQRPSLINYVDKVLILKAGTVEAYGPPEEVMQGRVVRAVPANKAS